VALITPPI